MYEEESSSVGGIKSTFEVYRAEGDMLFKQGDFFKALDSYNLALELKPGEKHCLVSRSQCYLQLGESELALADSEETLKEDKDYTKGLYQKAEALYQKGDFEFALVFYHRGHKLRPELKEFRLGIQKTEEAIDNSIGDNSGVKLKSDGDLSYFYKHEEQQKAKKKQAAAGGYQKPGAKPKEKEKRPRSTVPTDPKTVKQLLGQLYEDKQFLEKLLSGLDGAAAKTKTNDEIKRLAKQGLDYLDTRTEFWQQQKPMYSHERDRKLRENKNERKKEINIEDYIVRKMEDIDKAQTEGDFEKSLEISKRAMKEVKKRNEYELNTRSAIIGNLHSCMGNAYLEMGKYKNALSEHTLDLEIAKQNDDEDSKSRALDNLGRVYARMGDYSKAIQVWEEKLPMSKSSLESTWLYHEIGRCYLEVSKFKEAKEYGEKSLAAAVEAEDDIWQLNGSVLIAQAEVKLNDFQAALDSFEKALEMAKIQEDAAAEKAIKKAIEDVNSKIVKGMKEREEDDENTKTDDEQDKPEKSSTPEPEAVPEAEPESEKHDDSSEKQEEEIEEEQTSRQETSVQEQQNNDNSSHKSDKEDNDIKSTTKTSKEEIDREGEEKKETDSSNDSDKTLVENKDSVEGEQKDEVAEKTEPKEADSNKTVKNDDEVEVNKIEEKPIQEENKQEDTTSSEPIERKDDDKEKED